MKNFKNASRPADASGHDEPITSAAEDFYDRLPIAASIVRTIFGAPKNWSTRIGVFGQWGEGKTSILKLVEDKLTDERAVVIWYSAWTATSTETFWAGFADVLKTGFQRRGFPLTWRTTLRLRIARWVPALELGFLGGTSLLQLAGITVPEASVQRVSELIQRFALLGRRQIQTMLEAAQALRVVVMIDDLDRASPDTIPTILLAVRELLDMPGFSFVMAFDPAIVTQSLAEHNRAWSADGQKFIDKIIDFSFVLPAPSPSGIRRLAHDQFRGLCPFVPTADLDAVMDAIPENPRKLKLLARTVASYRNEVLRHNDDELNWPIIILLTLMRLESDTVARRFVQELAAGEYNPLWDAAGTEQEADERKKATITRLLEGVPPDSMASERLRRIFRVWDSDTTLIQAGAAVYQARFAVQPDSITWGEFDSFFKTWSMRQRATDITDFVQRRADASNRAMTLVAEEFLASVTMRYEYMLDRAAETSLSDDHADLLSQMNLLLTLYVQGFKFAASVGAGTEKIALLDALSAFIRVRQGYAHFIVNPGESAVRDREVSVIVLLAASVNKPLLAFEKLHVAQTGDDIFGLGPRAAGLLIDQLREKLEPACVGEAIDAFRSTSGVVGIAGLREQPALHYILSSPRSKFFEPDAQSKFEGVLRDASTDSNVAANARLYLQRLLSYRKIGGDPYLTQDQRAQFLRERGAMLGHIWRAATALRLQYRYLEGMREERARLLESGVDENMVPQPDWLTEPPA